MLCAQPFRTKYEEFGCGQCMACRINKQRMWTARIVLESMCHAASTFVTLTYKPESLPKGGTLVPRHTQLFLKRLRHLVGPLRFYLVGEYGDVSFRPHYHAALFGVNPLTQEEAIWKAWGQGNIHCGLVERSSAGYIAGYVTKKMTSADDPRLEGRHPEFSRMSRNPGIGVPFLKRFEAGYTSYGGCLKLSEDGDVSAGVRIGGIYPLGRTLRGKLREEVGWTSDTPSIVREARILARADRTPEQVQEDEDRRKGMLLRASARQKIYRQTKVI